MKYLIWLGVWLLFSLVIAAPVRAQAGDAIVRPQTATLNIGQGQVESVAILLENAHEVYGIDVRAKFDPGIVEVVDADQTRDGVQMIPGAFPQPDFLVRNIADNQAGTLRYVTTQVSPTVPINGTGVVFSVWFRGKALGKQSTLTIESVEISDRHGVKMNVQPQNGLLQVVAPQPPTATVLPTAAVNLTPAEPVQPAAGLNSAATLIVRSTLATPVPGTASAMSDPLWLITVGGFVGAVVLISLAIVVVRQPVSKRKSQ